MRRLTRADMPGSLVANEAVWTAELMHEVNAVGSWTALEKSKKASFSNRCKNNDIQAALVTSSHDKCAYCEGDISKTTYMEVDHFYPKSIYPQQLYAWPNLIPSCSRCNKAKGVHDVGVASIVDPYIVDVEGIFVISNIKLVVRDGLQAADIALGARSINILALNRRCHYRGRAEILIELQHYEDDIASVLDRLQGDIGAEKRARLIRSLSGAIDDLRSFASVDHQYSLVAYSFIERSNVIGEAQRVVDAEPTE